MAINPQGNVVNIDVTAYNSIGSTLSHSFMSYSTGNVTLSYTGGLSAKTIYVNGVMQGFGSVTFSATAGTVYNVEVK